MQRITIFIYGVLAYIVGLVGQIWLIVYISNWELLQIDINSPQNIPLFKAINIDILLVLLFGLQHSLMARDWFKRWLTTFMPKAMERSTYVLLSGIAFIILCLFWQPINGYLWHTQKGFIYYALSAGFVFGWVLSVISTFVINHFELFGLQQVYFNLRNKPTPNNDFQERLFYKFIRHPIQLGIIIGLWVTPIMSYGHLLLALLMTIYIFIGLHYEENDLIKELGDTYAEYKKRVGMLLPKK